MINAGKFTGWGYSDLMLMPSDFWVVLAKMIAKHNADVEHAAQQSTRRRR